MKNQIKVFLQDLHGGDISMDEELIESGILDSFAFIELIEFVESDLNIPIDFTTVDREEFKTIQDIEHYLEKLKK